MRDDDLQKPNTEELSAAMSGANKDVGAGFAAKLRKNDEDIVLTKKGGGLEVLEEVLMDDQVFSTFQQRRLALLSKPVDIQPGATDKASIMAADFLRENIQALQFDNICNKMMHGIFYGYGVAELIYGRDGKNWVFDDIKVRKARRFRYDEAGQLRLIKKSNKDGEVMPAQNFWTFESGSDNHDNPYGLALGSRCFWSVFFKRNGIRFWMLALEKYGAPTAVGKYPPTATKEEKQKLLEAAAAFASVSAVTIPNTAQLELLSAKAQVGGNHDKLVQYMDKAISKVVLSQTMTTDDGSSNSQANVHLGVREDITAADSDLQMGSFRDGPLRRLIHWNYPGATVPLIRRATEEAADLDAMVARDKTLYEMGFDLTDEHVLSTYGDGYVRRAPTEPALPSSDIAPGDEADFASFMAGETEIDPVAAFLSSRDHLRDTDREIDDLITDIEVALSDAQNKDEAERILAGYLAVPVDDPMAGRLARILFNARIHGRAIKQQGE